MIVVDASAMIEILLDPSANTGIVERFFAVGEEVIAPHVIDLEIVQVFRRHIVTNKMPATLAQSVLEDWMRLPVGRYGMQPLLRRIFELRDNATAYDAAYIALAEAFDAPLVTHDAKLQRVPGHNARIELI